MIELRRMNIIEDLIEFWHQSISFFFFFSAKDQSISL